MAEESQTQIQVTFSTSLARIHDFRLIRLSSVRDCDFATTKRVVVGVAGVVRIHDDVRDGDDGVVVAGRPAAGAEPGFVVGEVACVGCP